MAEESKGASTEGTGFNKVWNDFMEHNRRAFEESGKAVDSLLPEGFKEHSAVARDEFRKGFKVLVDYTIDELEKVTKADDPRKKTDNNDDEPPKSTTGKTKVKVQVE